MDAHWVQKLSNFVTKKAHLVTFRRRKIINGKTFITRRVQKYSVTSINGNYFENYTKNMKYYHRNCWIVSANVQPHRWMCMHKNGTIEISTENCTCYYVYSKNIRKLLQPTNDLANSFDFLVNFWHLLVTKYFPCSASKWKKTKGTSTKYVILK